jgi:hypothetical protein
MPILLVEVMFADQFIEEEDMCDYSKAIILNCCFYIVN